MDQTQELSAGGYEMLRAAVNAAREHQYRTVARLKERLLAAWPGRAQDIEAALTYWSADIRRRHPTGLNKEPCLAVPPRRRAGCRRVRQLPAIAVRPQ